MSRYRTTSIPVPPPPRATILEAVQELLDYYIGLDLWVFASILVLTSLVGRYGLTAVLMAPVTFAVWLFQSIKSFRRFQPVIIVWGGKVSEDTPEGGRKLETEPDVADAAGGEQGFAGPNAAAQRAASLRNRRQPQPMPGDGSI